MQRRHLDIIILYAELYHAATRDRKQPLQDASAIYVRAHKASSFVAPIGINYSARN